MSKLQKEIDRLKYNPKDYTYEELKSLLNKLGFVEYNKGKTSGARIQFFDASNRKIFLHKPHPNNIIKPYVIREIINFLEEWRLI